MLHLFHLGPVVTGERRLWLLAGVNEEGGFTHPLLGPDLPSGLAALSAQFGPQRLRVEPALEAIAAPFGIRAEPLPDRARVPRAVHAFALLTGHRLFRKPSAVSAFLEACVEFEKAAPWTRFRPDEPFAILMARSWRCWKREFAVRGAQGQGPGLELHEKPGSVERALRSPRKVDSLLVTFEAGPSWAMEAVREAHGLGALPTVIRLRPGSRQAPDPLELLQLATALRSAALLSAEDTTPEHGACVALTADGYALEAVAAPLSHLRPESRTPRPLASAV